MPMAPNDPGATLVRLPHRLERVSRETVGRAGRHALRLVIAALWVALPLVALSPTPALAQEGAPGGSAEQGTPEGPPTAAEPGAADGSATENRIITIDGSGGTQRGNLRFGPIIYEHPEPNGIRATVSTLTILGSYAELSAPEGVSISRGGQRVARFQGGVEVERGRLSAEGPELEYDEATGLGVLGSNAAVVVAATEEGDEPVFITADQVAFDVDTDRSTSTGGVHLVNGNQTADADQLVFEEDTNLGVLTSAGSQAIITRLDEDGSTMTITADEIRVLTDVNRLYARGNVTVVDGAITSTGSVVFFDDETGVAEVIGDASSPARSVDADSGATLVTDRIKQDIEFDFFEAIDSSVPSDFDVTAFALRGEAQE